MNRTLVTLPIATAQAAERFRAQTGQRSESAALVQLVRDGLAYREGLAMAAWFDPSHPINL